MKSFILFLCFYVPMAIFSFGQPQSDPSSTTEVITAKMDALLEDLESPEQVIEMCDLIRMINMEDPQTAFPYAEKAVKEAEKLGDKEALAQAYNVLGRTHKYLGEYESMANAYQKTLDYRREMGDDQKLGTAYSKLAAAQLLTGEIQESLSSNEKAIDLYRKTGDEEGLVICYSNVGTIYSQYLGDFQKGIEYTRLAVEILEKQKSYEELALALNNLATSYLYSDSIDKAKATYLRCYELRDQIENREVKANTLIGLGDIEGFQNGPQASIKYYQEGWELVRGKDLFITEQGILWSMGDAYAEMGNHSKAIYYDSIAIGIQPPVPNFMIKEGLLRSLYLSYKASGKPAKALQYYEQYIAQRDSFQAAMEAKKPEEETLNFELGQREDEIDELEAQQKLSQTRMILFGVLGGVILISLVFIIFLQVRLRRNASTLQEQEKALIETRLQLKEMQILEGKQAVETFKQKLIDKNQMIEELKAKLESQNLDEENKSQAIKELMDMKILTGTDWQDFRFMFNRAYPNFLTKLKQKQSDLSEGEIRLCLLLKLEMSLEQIGDTLGISLDGVRKARYRLKKKVGLDRNDDLVAWMEG